ncbi:MAG: tetratricopeptide repeat protein [Bacteroidales bacterium]|nr:tetratricopeptide repeat protein [Bacteroidales bacterium]
MKNEIVADSLFPQLFALSESELQFEQFDPILPYRNYGLYMRQLGRDEEACRYFRIALHRYLDSLGMHHFQTGQSYLYLGECYQAIGNPDSARVCLDRAVDILDPDSLITGSAQNELFQCHLIISFCHY